MAPKKSKKVKVVKGLCKAKACPKNMQEVDEMAASHLSRKRRTLGRRDSEEKLSRQLSQHFSHMSQQQLATVRVDGLLVRDRIKADRDKLLKGDRRRLSSSYWRDLVSEYTKGLGTFGALPKPNSQLPVRKSLSHCLSLLYVEIHKDAWAPDLGLMKT